MRATHLLAVVRRQHAVLGGPAILNGERSCWRAALVLILIQLLPASTLPYTDHTVSPSHHVNIYKTKPLLHKGTFRPTGDPGTLFFQRHFLWSIT